MKKLNLIRRIIAASFFLVLSPILFAQEKVRLPQFADSFYPANKTQLSDSIQKYLNEAPLQKIQGDLWGLIAPHAGHIYSGKVAAFSYKFLTDRKFDTVILIGPSHHIPFEGASVWQEGSWVTPLGEVPVDKELARKIASENEKFKFGPELHAGEHSLEVEIPFLQMTLKDFRIVPVLLGNISLENAALLAQAIAKNTEGKKVLVIASTDMSHYHPQEEAGSIDHRTLDLIQQGNSADLFTQIHEGKSELCGAAAVLTLLELAKLKPHSAVQFLKYADSSNASGDTSKVVGYSAWVFYSNVGAQFIAPSTLSGAINGAPTSDLSQPQQKKLLKIAREALENFVLRGKPPQSAVTDPALFEKRGTFVTLRKKGELRGCIGNIVFEPLFLAVGDNAVKAATVDRRFLPLKSDEIKDVQIEISVLSPFRRIKSIDEIQIGRDGVFLQKGSQSGLFLPQVAQETRWDKERFMNELCTQKAGLPANCWKDPDLEMYVFTAQVFDDSTPHGQ